MFLVGIVKEKQKYTSACTVGAIMIVSVIVDWKWDAFDVHLLKMILHCYSIYATSYPRCFSIVQIGDWCCQQQSDYVWTVVPVTMTVAGLIRIWDEYDVCV